MESQTIETRLMENQMLKDAAGLGLVLFVIASAQLWSFVLS